MAKSATPIKQSVLLTRMVLDRRTMEDLGRVEVIWMYPSAHRVLGFVCKSGMFGNRKRALNLAQIHSLGEGSILVSGQPTETDAARVQQLESMVGKEVWSDSGEQVGRIVDYTFSLQNGAIAHYWMVADRLFGLAAGIYQIAPRDILNIGATRVLVPDRQARQLTLVKPGIKQTITQVGDRVKDSYSEVVEELRSLAEQAQSTTGQAKEQLEHLTETAKHRAQPLTDQAQKSVRAVQETLQHDVQELTQKAKQTSQKWLRQAKSLARNLEETLIDALEFEDSETDSSDVLAKDSGSSDADIWDNSSSDSVTDKSNNETSEEQAFWVEEPILSSDNDEPWEHWDEVSTLNQNPSDDEVAPSLTPSSPGDAAPLQSPTQGPFPQNSPSQTQTLTVNHESLAETSPDPDVVVPQNQDSDAPESTSGSLAVPTVRETESITPELIPLESLEDDDPWV
jgi:uncharacterized protein YrrD